MNRLLIVDDEKFTVDGLYEMIEDTPDLELDLYRAYSPEEALEWLSRTKIDIVLSDVRMPGMTGLELQQRIVAQWPRCKIIFLTGIHNLETAQLAVRSGSIDYILKTEGDEAIIRSIQKAIDSLAEESESSQFMLQAKERMSRALPLLHRDWVMSLLELQSSVTYAKLQEVHIPLSSELPVIPLIGRVDQWQNTAGYQDQSLLLYAVQNIAAEYYASLSFFSVSLDMHHFICLIQPSLEAVASASKPESELWRDTVSFVQGTMLSVQQTCDRLLKLPVSLICGAGAVGWQQLPHVYGQMRKQLLVGLGSRDRMLLILDQQQEEGEEAADQSQPALPPLRTMTAQLERLLEVGGAEEFAAKVKQYAALPTQYADYALVYYAVASVLLSQLTQAEARQDEPAATDIDIDMLMNLAAHKSREAAVQFLLSTAAAIHERRSRVQSERTHQLICKLHQFIRGNLGGDLSLTRLSEVVYLNPAYLSVLYKQQTGRNLSDYIAELRLDKAKELLLATPFKIHEIADKVGFETSGYFTRFFKKRLQMTPQEYRAKE
ncbi:two-component system response regulator YesN [Paenibacillus taihuensis]|uniref:Two-component system response regulator YesN n=1 Tax=Paenibacillus taihuensis TaxID=1156355 RepID=A0A3D9S7Y8_9BACL|nr:response regulator [Paenibacillus taihuensis]REE86411.1 two-component system response regulator YesN [Paenibacillus taihuensis]